MQHCLISWVITAGLSASVWAAALPEVIELPLDGKALLQHEHVIIARGKDHLSLKFKDGQEHYVENLEVRMLGDDAAKVVIDGGYTATVGGVGKEQDYPMVVRANTLEITVRSVADKPARVESLKINTRKHIYSSYQNLSRKQRQEILLKGVGEQLQSLVDEFIVLSTGRPFAHDVFRRFLRPLKQAALQVQRKPQDAKEAPGLLKAIEDASLLFESDIMSLDGRYEILSRDLLAIKKDLVRKYKLKK